MPNWTGFLDNTGTPRLRIAIKGPFSPSQEFDAIIDTGFSGFLSMPLVQAFPLGLILYGTTTVILADGSTSDKLAAQGMVQMTGVMEIGLVILEPGSSDVLIGMEFLRAFKMSLFVYPGKPMVSLVDEAALEAIIAANQPPAAPDVTQSPQKPDDSATAEVLPPSEIPPVRTSGS